MIYNFEIVKVDNVYCDYLRKIDNKVQYNKGIKELRPFIGVLFVVNNCKYFAPLSSPKEKHIIMKNQIDFIKIDSGNLGAINLNNMIPVQESNYTLIDINSEPKDLKEKQYKNMLKKQLIWLNKKENKLQIISKAKNLHNSYIKGKLPINIINSCCDFYLLEIKCIEYNKLNK